MITFALLAMLLQDPKDVTKDWKHPWSNATVGSSIRWKITVAGFTTEVTETVTKVEKATVTTERKDADSAAPATYFTGLPGEFAGKASTLADEELKVGDKSYPCSVTQFRFETKGAMQVLKVWRSPDAPCWAVRQTYEQHNNGKLGVAYTEEFTGTAKLKVGEKELACAVVKRTSTVTTMKTVETEWRSAEIPGGAAKKTKQIYMNDKEVAAAAELCEVVAFEKK